MNESVEIAEAEVWLDRGSRRYAAAEQLTGQYDLAPWRESRLESVEIAVLWYTAGQGEEDFCVHHFERHDLAALPAEGPLPFATILPSSPPSYDGQIVKVCWTVRLRGFFAAGQQRLVEAPFWLGEVAG